MARTAHGKRAAAAEDADAAENGTGATQGAAKRSKASDAAAETEVPAVAGSVLKVKMRNFMTYSNVEFAPGRRLNLILGPNGTGKSSFVCAMCMGLAGKPSLLGRGDKVSEFIKRGEDAAEVEVTLCTDTPGRPLVVWRKIKKDNSSDWKLNGVSVGLKKVEEAMRNLNVQLDNLCQFLPQDRVVAFAQLKPTELLLETEKAIGDSALLKMHMELIAHRNDIKGLETRVGEHVSQLARLEEQNAALERDVEKMNERNRLQADIDDLKKKIPWLKFNDAKEKWEQSRAMLKTVKETQKAGLAQLAAAQAPIKERQAVRDKADAARKKLKSGSMKLEDKKAALDDEILTLTNRMEQAESELSNIERQQQKQKDNLQRKTAEVEELEQQLADLPLPQQADAAEMDALKAQSRELTARAKELQFQLRETAEAKVLPQRNLAHITERIRKMDDMRNQRVRAIAQKEPKIIEICNWVEKAVREGRFQSDVFGPLLAEVNIPDAQHAKYLEQHCPGYLWSAFVTTSGHDQQLMQEMVQKHRCTVINYVRDASLAVPSPEKLGELRNKYELVGTLDSVYEAPAAVKHILNDLAGTGSAFVGSANTERLIDRLIQEPGVKCVWTPKSQYTQSKSRYANATSSRVVAVRECQFFTRGAAAKGEKEQLRVQATDFDNQLVTLGQQTTDLQAELNSVDKQLLERRKKLDEIVNLKTRYEKEQQKINSSLTIKKHQLNAIKKTPPGQTPETLKKRVASINAGRLKTLWEYHETNKQLVRNQLELDPLQLTVAHADLHINHFKDQLRNLEERNGQLLLQATQCEEIRKADKEAAVRAKEAAEKIAKLPDPELEKKFETMPPTVVEVQERVKDLQTEADALWISDPDVLQQYEERTQKIVVLKEKLEVEQAELDGGQTRIQAVKDTWLPKLHEVVLRMNTSFGNAFSAIGSVGELELVEHADYDKYEIRVRVKFRAEEALQTLSSHRQSGGERSVSTMLYLIALQEFTKCPFRVVDEINQGMDAVNERKIFTKMVEAACRPDTPQCFLLTPKLLPQLEYSPAVTVLLIMNGPRAAVVAKKWTAASSQWYKPSAASAPLLAV